MFCYWNHPTTPINIYFDNISGVFCPENVKVYPNISDLQVNFKINGKIVEKLYCACCSINFKEDGKASQINRKQ